MEPIRIWVLDRTIVYLHESALSAVMVFWCRDTIQQFVDSKRGCERLLHLMSLLLTVVVAILPFCRMCGTHNCLLMFPIVVDVIMISILD